MARDLEGLTEEERRALRGSKFAPLPSAPPPSQSRPRLSHPGGPLATNKAAALGKFLERKLNEPGGIDSMNPDLLELAVKNAKDSVKGAGSNSGRRIRHVISFDDPKDSDEDGVKHGKFTESKVMKHKKKKKRRRKQKDSCEDGENQDKGEGNQQKKRKKMKNKKKRQKMVDSSGN